LETTFDRTGACVHERLPFKNWTKGMEKSRILSNLHRSATRIFDVLFLLVIGSRRTKFTSFLKNTPISAHDVKKASEDKIHIISQKSKSQEN
jgi:hypothetical protein